MQMLRRLLERAVLERRAKKRVRGKGWVKAAELVAGDLLSGDGEQWLAVDEVYDTSDYETVYNLRVADFHTYFVGCQEWGFSVWAHNEYTETEKAEITAALNNVPEFRRASIDRFFLCIDADDAKFERERTWKFLESLGAIAIEEVEE